MIMTNMEIERLDTEARRLLEAYNRGQHTSLLTEVDELSKQGPLTAGLLGLAASSLVALERFDEAVTAARGALEREPRWAWLYLALSRAEAGRGDWAKATEAGRSAVQIMPGETGYLANLAQCQRESGQAALAVKTARQALSIDPADPESLSQLGLALEATGDPEGALEHLQQAQAISPDDPSAYLHEGALHRRAGRVGLARRAFREALRRNPGLTEAEDRLVETLSESLLVRKVLMHLLSLARLTVVGWAIVAFLYYVFFRMLEILWKSFAIFLPFGRVLLGVTFTWLVGGALVGWGLRVVVRRLR
ncbi:MAG: tetratricopeptide repeat protein [Bacillota bacterium]